MAGRRGLLRAFGALSAILVLAALIGLGIWQVQRLAWKKDLIARVDARLTAVEVPAPGPQAWAGLSDRNAEYLRVMLNGTYLPGKDVLVQAVTARGAGFWVMTPMQTPDGWIALVNRGFVPSDARSDYPAPVAGLTSVSGLLRMTQPKGAFLRSNDPADGRWYSRDTQAIGATLGLANVAPWFIDAKAGADPDSLPVGGLTVVQFRNSHLGYAFTWFGLAVLWAGTLIYLRKRRRG